MVSLDSGRVLNVLDEALYLFTLKLTQPMNVLDGQQYKENSALAAAVFPEEAQVHFEGPGAPSLPVEEFVSSLQQYRKVICDQLATTVAEDKSTQELQELLRKNAVKTSQDKQQLELCLASEALALRVQLDALVAQEERGIAELQQLQNATLQRQSELQREAEAAISSADTTASEQEKVLLAQLEALESDCRSVQSNNKAEEIELRQLGTSLQGKLNKVVKEYDELMQSKDHLLEDEINVYNNLLQDLLEMEHRHQHLITDRKWFEEVQAKLEEEKKVGQALALRQYHCARRIQRKWKQWHMERLMAAKKLAKKKKRSSTVGRPAAKSKAGTKKANKPVEQKKGKK